VKPLVVKAKSYELGNLSPLMGYDKKRARANYNGEKAMSTESKDAKKNGSD
jgi:hypothetical protein